MNRAPAHIVLLASLTGTFLEAGPARAASMQKVNQSDWWEGVAGLPSYVNMYIYVPDAPAAKPPIVVAPHHCQGTAQSTFSEMSSLVSIANTTGFIMIMPEATGENCWDAGSNRSLQHGGGGDTGAIVQMVKYTLSKYGADAGRVYTVGASSGGIMTEALLGVYPDVFMAGVSYMGVPCGCWAQSYNDVTGNGSTAQWSSPCAGGSVSMTGEQWATLVRGYFPGYTGHRPRLQHWHGTADTTLNYKNMAEDVKEWTALLGLSETPTGSDTPKSGTAHQFWKNACGYTVYETFALSGVGHAVPFDGPAVAAYFGLDQKNAADPETAMCGGGTGGAGGQGGMGGSSGDGAGGMGGAAAAAGASGSMGRGGAGGRAGAGMGGGASSVGGATGAGGATTSGTSGTGATSGNGGATATAGSGAAGGAPAEGGSGAAGGTATSGGMATSGGTSPGAGGAAAPAGGTNMDAASPSADSSGCACTVTGREPGSAPGFAGVVLAALALVLRRRRGRSEPPGGRASGRGAARGDES